MYTMLTSWTVLPPRLVRRDRSRLVKKRTTAAMPRAQRWMLERSNDHDFDSQKVNVAAVLK